MLAYRSLKISEKGFCRNFSFKYGTVRFECPGLMQAQLLKTDGVDAGIHWFLGHGFGVYEYK